VKRDDIMEARWAYSSFDFGMQSLVVAFHLHPEPWALWPEPSVTSLLPAAWSTSLWGEEVTLNWQKNPLRSQGKEKGDVLAKKKKKNFLSFLTVFN